MNVGVMKDKKVKLRDLHDRIHWVVCPSGGPEHRKIETKLISERFASAMGLLINNESEEEKKRGPNRGFPPGLGYE
jgi:hypothetical protein